MNMNWGNITALGLTLTKKISDSISPEKRHKLAKHLGALTYKILPSRKKTVKHNLIPILKQTDKDLNLTAINLFKNFAITLSDFITPKGINFTTQGKETADELIKDKKPFVLLTFHLGAWELGTHMLTRWGWPSAAVYNQYRSKKLHNFIQSLRSPSLEYIKLGENTLRAAMKTLNNGKVLILLGDRPFGQSKTLELLLFGKKTLVPKGPIVIASRSGVPIIPAFIIRTGNLQYTTYFEKPMFIQKNTSGNTSKFIIMLSELLEKYILSHPDQWYRFEQVWI